MDGARRRDSCAIGIVITEAAFSADAEIARFAAGRSALTGAIATFAGYCRGDDVTRLELQHYPGFTESEVRKLAERVVQRHAVDRVRVVHRVGAIPAGEAIVLVAAESAHRAAAFATVNELMDYLKTDAPLWKRAVGPDGARWIEPTADDRARRRSHGD